MISFRTLVLTTIGVCTLSMYSAEQPEVKNPLAQAAAEGDLATIQKLDPEGLNEPFEDGEFKGQTPQYMAAVNGKLEVIKYYVNKQDTRRVGINPPLTFGEYLGETPLFAATAHGWLSVVKFYVETLERKGYDINPPLTGGPYDGRRPFDQAIIAGRDDIFDYYVEKLESRGDDINTPQAFGYGEGMTPLCRAAAYGRKAMFDCFVKRLQRRGEDINPPATSGQDVGLTPLYSAGTTAGRFSNGLKSIVEFYITTFEQQHKDINPPIIYPTHAGLTPLYGAAFAGKVEIVDLYERKLQSQHKDINAPLTGKFLGFTPFYIAVRAGQKNVAEYYIKKLEGLHQNINPALTSGAEEGRTPLVEAIKYRHERIVKMFVHRGVSLTDTLLSGKTAEDMARTYDHLDLAYYLRKIAPLTQQLLTECYAVRDLLTLNDAASIQKATEALPRIRKLMQDGAEIEAQGKGGYTPLHCLIGYYDSQAPTAFDEMVKELIKSGKVDLKVLTDNGDSVLTIAAKFGNSRIFKYLLAKGADPTIGNNPIIAATENSMRFFRSLKMPH